MPRDSNGNYTLPGSNPVAPGTTIESTWANDTMSDMAGAMTDSLSRSGQGGMLAPFQNASGSEASPGITWTADNSTGVHFDNASGVYMYFSVSGSDNVRVGDGSLEVFLFGQWRQVVSSSTVIGIEALTQSEYDALSPPDPNITYLITGP